MNERMQKIKSKNTRIEMILRRALWANGLRYKVQYNVCGRPDIAFPSKKLAIFCDSEFWHGYNFGSNKKHDFKSNKKYWSARIKKNIERDTFVNEQLKWLGWKVLRFWEKEIIFNTDRCVEYVKKYLEKINES